MLRKFSVIMILITPMLFSSCGGDGPEPIDESILVEVVNDITEVTTWYADSIYIIKNYNMYIENTLTIQAGTIIKFTDDGPELNLGSSGTILANGTSDKPIIFTSFKDDAHGGDTNRDGDATSPASQDWGCINTNDANGSIFKYCEFYYGGGNSYSNTLVVYGNSIKVDHCTFAHNDGDNVYGIGALDANSAGSNCDITNNIFYDNEVPLSINLEMSLDNSNIFSKVVDGEEIGNEYNGIFVETGDDLGRHISWGETEVAYVIDDNDWWINSGSSLTLANDVVLKFRPGSYIVMNESDGIQNYDGTGVAFTSYKDDDRKGDTNGDGDATDPAEGDWGGIIDNINSVDLTWSNMYFYTPPVK